MLRGFIICLLWVGVAGAAEPANFLNKSGTCVTVQITGNGDNPPVTECGSGMAQVLYSLGGDELRLFVSVEGYTSFEAEWTAFIGTNEVFTIYTLDGLLYVEPGDVIPPGGEPEPEELTEAQKQLGLLQIIAGTLAMIFGLQCWQSYQIARRP